ncbi:hypothetical protein L2E82_13811 [Cichorium intybus]|uniref:Uncharacterized protein n=1 Tax=Cichorium intybus TaxID=13427 RepID=A0ACB9EXX5_CICIN|nr:hypothetical protein L2E82_13811 [Cichorium intybus]
MEVDRSCGAVRAGEVHCGAVEKGKGEVGWKDRPGGGGRNEDIVGDDREAPDKQSDQTIYLHSGETYDAS